MTQETAISKAITKLSDVRNKFNLTRSSNPLAFAEWLGELPELTATEIASLDRLKNRYFSYTEGDEINDTL